MDSKESKSFDSMAIHEIEHGRMLASSGAEALWGWGSPAGQHRAERRGAMVAAAAKLRAGISVLELGCGTGLFSAKFAETGALVTGIDISPELIEIARKKVKNAKFVCGRFEDAGFPEKFDAVVGSSVLHHLNISAALDKSRQLLVPGGRLAFAEPNMLNPQIFAERTFLRDRLASVSPDETAFVRWRLAHLLREHGFVEVSIQPFDWLHPAVPIRLVPSVKWVGNLLEQIPLVKEFAGSLIIRCKKG